MEDTTATSNNRTNAHRLSTGTTKLSSSTGDTVSSSLVYHCKAVRDSNSSAYLKYGWKSFRPDALQRLNTPGWFVTFLCSFILTQGMMVNGLKSLVISTLEKRFDFSSTEVGIISSTNEVSVAILGVYVSYFGAQGHRPKWLARAAILVSVGGMMFSLPHFIAGRYQTGATEFSKQQLICNAKQLNSLPDSCAVSSHSSNLPIFLVFLAAQVLIGAGMSPIFTLGTAFIEESVYARMCPIYLGIMYSTAALAPAIGFFVGGACLNFFVDFGVKTSLRPEDPGWVGAWWMGFLLCSVMAIVCAGPLFGYPKELPGSAAKVKETVALGDHGNFEEDGNNPEAPNALCEATSSRRISHDNDIPDTSTGAWLLKLRLLPAALFQLLCNLTFVFDIMAMALEKLLIFGLGLFLPKLIESQFGVTASMSSIYTGLTVVPGIAGGTLVGGYLSARMNSDPVKNVKFAFMVTLVTMAACGSLVIGCPNQKIAGVTEPYLGLGNDPSQVNLTSVCNSKCACAESSYVPVCGSDGVTYFSPCHAGCHFRQDNETKRYINCTCIADGAASGGRCSSNCDKLPVYLFSLFTVLFLTFLSDMPATTVLLKSVKPDQKSLALGLQWLVIGLLGRIPGPMVFGGLIDDACLLWQDECGQRGSCVQYSNHHLTRLTVVSALTVKGLSATLFFLSWFCYRPNVKKAPVICSDNTNKERSLLVWEYETAL